MKFAQITKPFGPISLAAGVRDILEGRATVVRYIFLGERR